MEIALWRACLKGYRDVAEALLRFGVDPNNYWKPLWTACEEGHLEVVDVLLEHGADIYILDADQNSIFHMIEDPQVIQLLLSKLHSPFPQLNPNFQLLVKCFKLDVYDQRVHDVFSPFYEQHPELFLMKEEGKFLADFMSEEQERFFSSDFLALFKRSPLNTVRLHLCGYGESGKTTLLRRLERREDLEVGRTIGMELSSLRLGESQFSVFDYGGQKEFHTTHDRFFEGSSSVFAVVIGLVDLEGVAKPMDQIEGEFGYWDKFIRSCVEGGYFACLVDF